MAYVESEREIENQSQLLETMETRLEGLGAQVITDMPRSQSHANDRITDLMAQKMELEEEISNAIVELKSERREIQGILKHLKHADERAVIRFRYFMRMNWYDVANAMFGGRDDYVSKVETYMRRAARLHGNALYNMAAYIENHQVTGRK